ncbi:pre-rRNA-processing protein esf1 [Coemansia biformis]|uniref:Pre-rRNA-processing protein esf1 n=1 Tax=Coemansia biformis TaxID=1286918 RepID=A0A9W7YH80_9FUNG|nr:pre-rRNA-processing protein esf1 [Coemansia biformis]
MPPRSSKAGGKAGDKADSRPVQKVTQDSRFSHVQEDPRFRRPKKSNAKVKVDKRFAHMIDDKDFTETTKVDRYGRVQEDNRAKAYLNSTYDFGGSESGSGTDGSDGDEERDGGADNSSESDSEGGSDAESGDSDESSGDEDIVDHARGKGIASDASSDSEDDSDVSDVEWGRYGGAQNGGLSDIEEDPDSIPRGDETKRFACVNMDWDHVRATDLYAVFSGFKPDSGTIVSVRIYPSEFGTERMAKEAIEGPPRAIFDKARKGGNSDADSDSDSDSGEVDLVKEQVKDNDEIDQVALRKYELEKMRYYFAVVECSSAETARAIYSQCDGSEFEASANFFDLRFIPDDMEFEQKPHEEATHKPENYAPADFTTQALQHSNIQLTWDADEPSRVKATRRAFTQDELDKMDFGNLLASSSDDGSSDDEEEVARKRALLLSGGGGRRSGSDSDGDDDDGDAAMGDIEITFTPGLSEAAAARMEAKKKAGEATTRRADETPIERFRRLKQEKRDKWKETKAGAGKAGHGGDDDSDDDNLVSGNELDASIAGDSFFTLDNEDELAPAARNDAKAKKGARESKTERKQRVEVEAKERAELELLLEGPEAERSHFDLKEIIKAEKRKGHKGKRGKKNPDVEDDFKLNVDDSRFGALFDSHTFAIDPNNPNFKKTKAMQQLLSESRKRHKASYK